MISTFESLVAFRYLRSKRKEVFISIITVISILGVALSVAVLDVTLAVMTGFEKELQAKLLDTSAHVVVRQPGGQLANWQEVREKIVTVPGVVAVTPFTYNQALITAQGLAHGLLIRGIANEEIAKSKLRKTLTPGANIDDLFSAAPLEIQRPDGSVDVVSLPPIIVGRALRNRFDLPAGTPVTLLSPQFSAAPQGLVPKMRRFLVIGNYSSGLMEYESGLAYTSIESAQAFFGMGQTVSGLEVMVDDLQQAKAIGGEIAKALGDNIPYDVTDWTVPNKPLWDALKLEKRVYFIVLLLLTLVASFSIVSTLVMVVMEKSRDIAILKSMGAGDSSVMRIFLLQGAFIGLTGTILGSILGLLGCLGLKEWGFPLDEAVFSLKQVPVEMVPSNFALVAVSAFLITLIAGIYPSRRAAKLRPADALRFE